MQMCTNTACANNTCAGIHSHAHALIQAYRRICTHAYTCMHVRAHLCTYDAQVKRTSMSSLRRHPRGTHAQATSKRRESDT